MKHAFTESYEVSKTINAPLDFVYAWCTDFRGDDLKMIGSKNRRNIHERTKKRVIWTVEGMKLPSGTEPVRVVWLRPPAAWHLETCGDGNEIWDYKLTPVGKNKTRLDMRFSETSTDKAKLQSKEDYMAETLDHWNKYARFLERDYEKSVGV
jgi:hypothetical protein